MKTWTLSAHYPSVEIVQISIEDNIAKRLLLKCNVPKNITKLNKSFDKQEI